MMHSFVRWRPTAKPAPNSLPAVAAACAIAAATTIAIATTTTATGAAATAWAGQKAIVPDVLDTPAMIGKRQLKSLQLAVGRSGNRLVSVGEGGVVLLSDDGGTSWRQARAVPVSVTLTDVAFIGNGNGSGWAVGHGGVLLRTADGGETWHKVLDGHGLARLMVAEAERLTAGGALPADAAEALRANAAYMVSDGPDKPLLDLHVVSEHLILALGAYGIALASRDGGATWTSFSAALPNAQGAHLYGATLCDAGLVIVGERGALFLSRDLGRTFEAVPSPYEGTFFGVVGLRDGGVLAFGLKGNAWRADAALTAWRRVKLPEPVTIPAGLTLEDGRILLGDETGRLLLSQDDGRSFDPMAGDAAAGVTGLAQAGPHAIALATVRGPLRIALGAAPAAEVR